MALIDEVKQILADVLQLEDRVNSFREDTALLGALPEFDSMAVISIITALEEQYDFFVNDDEIDAEVFESLGNLVSFVERKLAQ